MFAMKIRTWWNPEPERQRLLAEGKQGIHDLAEFVAYKARLYCPVDTGELFRSIQVIHEADGMRSHVVATAPHAEPVEYGHVMRNGQFRPPVMFLRRALNDGAREMPRFVGRSAFQQGFHRGAVAGATFET